MNIEDTRKFRTTVASLGSARKRRESGLFKAEGTKCVLDTLAGHDLVALYATHAWAEAHPSEAGRPELIKATRTDIERMSSLSTATEVIAVYRLPDAAAVPALDNDTLTVALDGIQDPGNLGTIVRVCDWMGVKTILASEDTVDVFNPKVVQATMGSLARVRVAYCDLAETLKRAAADGVKVYGTFLDGTNLYKAELSRGGVIVMGNEGHGIRPECETAVNSRLFIPPYPADGARGESLNVAVATSVTLSEFRRRLW